MYPLGTLPTMKDVGRRIRVQRDLREAFLEVCRAQDKPAAQVLREFMRGYVTQHDAAGIENVHHQDETASKPAVAGPKSR